jgi:uncharacterized protein (TIGR02231 family)
MAAPVWIPFRGILRHRCVIGAVLGLRKPAASRCPFNCIPLPAMKYIRLLPLLLLGTSLGLRAASVDSRLTAATVYVDRAVVTRTAAVDLAAGEQTVTFERLPAALLDQSLQVSGHGTATASILDVSARTAFVDFTPNARVQELEDQIRGLLKQGRALDDRAGILGQEREFVKRMLLASTTGPVTAPAGADAAARPTLEEWQKLYGYSEDALGKIAAELQSIDEQKADLAAKQTALEQQLNELRGAGGKSYKTVTVRLAVTGPGRLEVALKYAVPGATWAPSYDARLHVADRALELGYFGLVRNATGEDWNDIALTLSTARPSLGGGTPELAPWIVDVARPVAEYAARGGNAAVRMTEMAEKRVALLAEAPPAPAVESAEDKQFVASLSAVVEMGATSATFKIPVTVTLPANNTVQRVPIATAKLAADLQYQATPKLMETAFLSATATNNTEYPFLAGALNTFLDDTFVAASRLKTVMPGEKFELQLGADEGIALKRKLVNRFTENTGLTNKGRRVTYEYLITLANHKKTAERVVFTEPVPVSRNEKIEVTLLTPAAGDIGTAEQPKEVTRGEDGKLVWRLDLKPGEERKVPLKFAVAYPADLNVAGLE